ncbi:MAG: hypothetical protein V3W37_02975 [Candidatus Binatia bacterium]
MKLTELKQRIREKYTRVRAPGCVFYIDLKLERKWKKWDIVLTRVAADKVQDTLARALAKIVEAESLDWKELHDNMLELHSYGDEPDPDERVIQLKDVLSTIENWAKQKAVEVER